MQHWQDFVITAVIVMFSISLIPMVRDPQKPPLTASIPTSLGQWILLIVYFSLHFWLSVIITVVSASLWTALAIQRYRQDRVRVVKRGPSKTTVIGSAPISDDSPEALPT